MEIDGVVAAGPACALLSSSAADAFVASRGFSSVSQLLAPFSQHYVNIRDPSTAAPQSCKISLDIRDLRKDGYLLSLTVLPHVLHEALLTGSAGRNSMEVALKSFTEAVRHWAEPVEQETFRTYLACFFFISPSDANPLAELSQLIQAQHTQQHSSTQSESNSLAPSHCARPLWTTPSTLKHYVLLYDAADDIRAKEIFSSMCSTYGVENCSQLGLAGEGAAVEGEGGLPPSADPWTRSLSMAAILQRGLSRARASILEKTSAAVLPSPASVHPSASSPVLREGITTISSSYSIASSASTSASPPLRPSPPPIPPPPIPPPPRSSRRNISQADKDSCSRLLENFAKTNLVPHLERLMRTLQDQISARRGISRSLTSGMRKWFGNTQQSSGAPPVSYSAESSEMQSRRLADLAFLSGLYSFAYQQYHAVKKEFLADQAMLHHAMALEMSALSLHLDNPQLNGKQFPVHYLENSLGFLMSNGARWPAVVRCALTAGRIFTHLEKHTDAAMHLAKTATLESDLCVGVCEWLAGSSFSRAGMPRKASFYSMLAGHRFSKAGLSTLSLTAFQSVYPQYAGKQWKELEDELGMAVASGSGDAGVAVECAALLLSPCRTVSPSQATSFLAVYGDARLRLMEGEGKGEREREGASRVPLPLLKAEHTRVVCGERPRGGDEWSGGQEWGHVERAAFHAIAGPSAAFHPVQLLRDGETGNERVRETPPAEPFRVQLSLANPLPIPLSLSNLHLGVTDIKMHDGAPLTSAFSLIHNIASLTMEPLQTTEVELWVVPSQTLAEFRVSSLLFSLQCSEQVSVPGEIALSIRGKRLNKTAKQMKSVVYANDERLRATVSRRPWPLLEVRVAKPPPGTAYCGQAIRLTLDMENVGGEGVTGLAVATDGVDCVAVTAEEEEEEEGWRVERAESATSTAVAFLLVGNCPLAMRQSLRVHVDVRAPSSSLPSHSLCLLLSYRGEGGSWREWRHRVTFSTSPLLDLQSKVMDSSHGLVCLSLRNCVAVKAAALAQLDVMEVKVEMSRRRKGKMPLRESDWLSINGLHRKPIHLEGGQNEDVCVSIESAREGGIGVWRPPPNEKEWPRPPWPLPLPPADNELPDNIYLSVLWKAKVVDNDGKASSLIGESYVVDPLGGEGLQLLGLRPESSGEGEQKTAAVSITCPPLSPLQHDFSQQSLCEVPLRVDIRNDDPAGRECLVEIAFKPRVRDISHPPPRQQWWLARECTHTRVAAHTSRSVLLRIRVAQPAAYDVLGSQMTACARFTGETASIPLRVPSSVLVLYDK